MRSRNNLPSRTRCATMFPAERLMSQSIYGHIECKEFRYSYFARIHLEADYTLLALLGGGPRQEPAPCFASRGVPADMNPLTARAYYLVVTDNEPLRDRFVSRQEADQWVASGASIWAGPTRITDPDFLNPSWLLTEEFEQVYGAYLGYNPARLPCVEAALAGMRLLPEARFVYWFW